jgi:hypothetical protein
MWRTMPPGGARCNSRCARLWWAWHDQRGTDMRRESWKAARGRSEGKATAGRWRVVNRVRRCLNRGKRREGLQRRQARHPTSSLRPARGSKGAPAAAMHKRLARCYSLPAHMVMRWNLTFDMRGAQKAQPFGHPLDGRVRAHSRPGDTWRT